MTYDSGTIGATANPGPALYTALETVLLTAGFTLVDTVVISSRTHKILESDAADNDRGLTWYLDVSYPTTGVTGGMLMAPFEDFDPATDLGYRGPYSANSTTIEGTYFSRYGSTGQALETQWANSTSYSALDNPLSTSGFGWFLSATTDRVIFVSTAAPGEMHYAGFFEATADHETAAGAALYPLIVAHFSDASSNLPSNTTQGSVRAALTRVPNLSAITWGSHVIIDIAYAQMGGLVGTGGSFVATGKTNMAKRPIVMGAASLSNSSPASAPGGLGLVGFLMDVANTWTDGTVARGDDLTDTNADVWIATDDTGSVGLWFKAV
jgi:hypothetical protein